MARVRVCRSIADNEDYSRIREIRVRIVVERFHRFTMDEWVCVCVWRAPNNNNNNNEYGI